MPSTGRFAGAPTQGDVPTCIRTVTRPMVRLSHVYTTQPAGKPTLLLAIAGSSGAPMSTAAEPCAQVKRLRHGLKRRAASRAYRISSVRGYRAVTTVEIPPRGRKSPFTSAQTGSVAFTMSFSTWFAMFS